MSHPENRPVHFSQQLVDCLSGIWMHRRLNPLSANAVQLIDEDHAGSIRFCLFCKPQKKRHCRLLVGFSTGYSKCPTFSGLTEKVPDSARTNTHKHLIKL